MTATQEACAVIPWNEVTEIASRSPSYCVGLNGATLPACRQMEIASQSVLASLFSLGPASPAPFSFVKPVFPLVTPLSAALPNPGNSSYISINANCVIGKLRSRPCYASWLRFYISHTKIDCKPFQFDINIEHVYQISCVHNWPNTPHLWVWM